MTDTGKESGTSLPPKLGAPAGRALALANIHTLEDVTKWSEAELLALHGVGPNAVGKLRAALEERGLSFAPGKIKQTRQAKGNK